MADVSIKKISPKLGGERGTRNPRGPSSSHDLVEQMEFLYVELTKVEHVPQTCIPIVDITLGNYNSSTRDLPVRPNWEWNQVFAFDKSKADVLSFSLKDGYTNTEIGKRSFKLPADIPSRVPPDARIAATNYDMQNTGMKLVMSIWFGTQADEVYSTAWFSDTCGVSASCVKNTRPNIYLAPMLCYLRVTIVSGHDLISHDGRRPPSAFVEVQVGEQKLKTGISTGSNPSWNQDLIFVASEPLEDLAVTIEIWDKLDDQHNQLIGTYHVFDECSQYCSDYRPFAKGLWPGVLGKLEVGILGATGLTPMKNSQFQRHAYTVAKYGNKWARTRTVVNNASPKWNEQCSWDIYEKCTVFTIGLYDNHQLVVNSGLDDVPIGKVRIPLSKLDWNKIYTGSFPILVLGKEGLKKTGEIQLAIRCAIPPPAWLFFSPSYFLATSPFRWMLPKSHYKAPLGLLQYEDLRSKAVEVICFNLNKTVPKLRNEVVKDMLKPRSKRFSMRRTIANFERLCRFFMWLYGPYAWLDANLVSTTDVGRKAVTFGVCFLLVVGHRFFLWLLVDWWLYAYIGGVYILYRVYKLRTVAFNMIMNRSNPATPLVLVDLKLSKLDSPNLDILDEEFDSMPSSESDVYVLRMRYDRMRKMGEKIMLLVGDFASQCERLQASWRLCTDHIVVVICLVFLGYGVLRLLQSETEYVFKSVLLLFISYWLKFPWHRYGLPSATKNYIRRFSSHEDLIIT
ncbi:unnamed protein product [Microthlaspi erraticum]|uniref:C2 domain-containing protein n=1 Tax=Microthlaspi erraticum TaxID=1685480 RepID=A0A6D2JFF8_9BRAS|nr:unnamed protein product [Microthlaspi erraticum]